MIKKCANCGNIKHTQDELHGKGNRVHNVISTPTMIEKRCTVCGASEKQLKAKK